MSLFLLGYLNLFHAWNPLCEQWIKIILIYHVNLYHGSWKTIYIHGFIRVDHV